MNPLDEKTTDWRRPEYVQLRDLLVVAYEQRRRLKQLAKMAGIAPGTFPPSSDLVSTCFELIEVLARQGIRRDFVELAARDPAITAYQEQFQELLDGWRVGPPTGGPAPRWKTSTAQLVTIQRQRLLDGRARMVRAELASEIAARAGSIALLTVLFGARKTYGTGFLIEDRLLLTARHNVVDEKLGSATAVTANFDHDETPRRSQLVLRVDPKPVASDPAADWAVLRAEKPTGRIPLTLGGRFPVLAGNPLVIIQHPRGGLKRFAFEHRAVTDVGDRHVQYLADTMAGSSGSPVCDEGMDVVAVHQCDVAQPMEIDGKIQTVWRNQGLLVEPILDELHRILRDSRGPGRQP